MFVVFCYLRRGWRRESGLSPPVKYFTARSKAVLLLWIICVIYVLCLPCFLACSLLPCGHLLSKGLTSCDVYLIVLLSLSYVISGSGVVKCEQLIEMGRVRQSAVIHCLIRSVYSKLGKIY